MRLEVWEKNDVFVALAEEGFDPREFGWQEPGMWPMPGGLLSRWFAPRPRALQHEGLVHRPTGHIFTWSLRRFTPSGSRQTPTKEEQQDLETHPLLVTFTVGQQRWHGQVDFAGSLEEVRKWLRLIRRELTETDLWAQLSATVAGNEQAASFFGLPPGESNTPFTDEERHLIMRELETLSQRVRDEPSLTDEQRDLLREHIEEMGQATHRLRRTDWRNAFVGSLVGLLMTSAIPPEAVHRLLVLAAHQLAQFFATGLPPAGPPALIP